MGIRPRTHTAYHADADYTQAWWLLDSRGVEDSQTCRGIAESTLLIRFVERVTSFLFFLPLRLRLRAYFDIWSQLPAASSTALPSLYIPVEPPVEQLDLQSLQKYHPKGLEGFELCPDPNRNEGTRRSRLKSQRHQQGARSQCKGTYRYDIPHMCRIGLA